jgi:hypothetical protein
MAIWASVFLDFWKRRQNFLGMDADLGLMATEVTLLLC